jgi:hypothetical protein
VEQFGCLPLLPGLLSVDREGGMSDLVAHGDSQHAKTRTLVSLRRDAAVHLQMIFSITPLVRLGKTLSATKPKAWGEQLHGAS